MDFAVFLQKAGFQCAGDVVARTSGEPPVRQAEDFARAAEPRCDTLAQPFDDRSKPLPVVCKSIDGSEIVNAAFAKLAIEIAQALEQLRAGHQLAG